VASAPAWNEKGEFPLELVPELAALGLTGLAVPHEYGGAELDVLTIALVMEELGAGDGSVALTIAAHNSLCIGHLLIAANEEQKSRWLPPLARGQYLGCWALTEPSSGSDAVSVQSRARREGDGYVLSGTKQFITNGSIAGFAVILAGAGERKLSAFGVTRGTNGFRVGRREEKMGLHASDTAQLVLEDCRVSAADRIGREGEAFNDVKGVLDRGRIGIAALAIGLGRASLEIAIGYAKERRQFGRPIAEFEMIQWRLARARTELDAARLLVHRAAALADAGLRFTDAASKAKLYASEAATRAADSSLQVLGGYGYLQDFPIERHLRDVRLMEIGEGTSEIQRIVVARELLRVD
jgi:alkylation response protein AidB-like acyl-CoA dehydrogenase